MNENSLNFEQDIPFINTRYGLTLGGDCLSERGRGFNGELSEVNKFITQFLIKKKILYFF